MTRNSVSYSLFFTGTGSGGNLSVGSSAAVLEKNGSPLLLIDCGPGTLNTYAEHYNGQLPSAVFLTHCHLDHIADLEILTVRARLRNAPPIPLFVPVSLITLLHQRLATYPGQMAEGDHDFWQSFQLRPVSDAFRYGEEDFRIYPTRHHGHGSSFALQLPGVFFYSGDTRPVPELLHHVVSTEEKLFHDCGVDPNPSHTGLADLAREYRPDICQRLTLYHYADESAGAELSKAGYQIACPGQTINLRPERAGHE